MLPRLDRSQRVRGAGQRIAGRLDHKLDLRAADDRTRIVGQPGASVTARGRGRDGLDLCVRPADRDQVRTRAIRHQVGNGDNMQAGRASRLRQEHTGELAAADHADAQWLARGLTRQELRVQVHRVAPQRPSGNPAM